MWWNNHWEPSLPREWTISPGPIHSAAFLLHAGDEIFTNSGSPKEPRHLQGTNGPALTWTQHLSFKSVRQLLSLLRKKKKFCYPRTEMCICQYWYFQFSSSSSIIFNVPSSPTINPSPANNNKKNTLGFSHYIRANIFLLLLIHAHGKAQREIGPKKELGPHYEAQCDHATSQIPTRHHYSLERVQRQNADSTDSTRP